MRCSCLCLLVLASVAAFAGESKRIADGKFMPLAPTIDGVINPEEWKDAFASSGFFDPVTSKSPSDDTEIWLGYDKDFIYVAMRAKDQKPGEISARSTQDGSEMEGEDTLRFNIDPLNRRRGDLVSQFMVNPLGTSFERIQGGRSGKKEWRGEWTKKARITETGWETEMRIPWKILSLPSEKKAEMQVNFQRYQFRTNTTSFWSDVTSRYQSEFSGFWKDIAVPTLPIDVSLQGYFAPEYDEDASPKTAMRAGIDARIKFTPTLNGLASLNPDFKNIEQQIAGIEFTRSERFLSDARPFFTEGADYFGLTGRFTFGRMFYTNRIEDFDQGLKFFGNLDRKNSFGLLAAREDGRRTDAVFNFSHQLDNRSRASFFGTTRQNTGEHNTTAGGTLSISKGLWGFGGDAAISKDGTEKWQKAGSAYVEYEAPNTFAILRGMTVAPKFNPALGLVPFTDRHGAYFHGEHYRELKTGQLKSYNFGLDMDYFDKEDGSNLFRSMGVNANVITRSDILLGLGASKQLFEDQSEESISLFGTYNFSNSQRQFGFSVNQGKRGGERSTFLNVFARYRVARGLDLFVSQSQQEYITKSDQTIGSVSWEIDKFQSISARWVGQDGDSSWYLSYRKAGNKGLEWYAIIGDPNSTTYRNRFALKVIWAR